MSHRSIARAFVAIVFILLAAVSTAAVAAKPTLKVGDPAPGLFVSKWLNGEPVAKLEPGTVYVIECWATWCGPCHEAIPHVSELNTKYKDKGVVVIGLNVWDNDAAAVEAFVAKMGEKMNYRVALDDGGEKGKTAAAWLDASGQSGIPTAFIVGKDGKLAWTGHPMRIEPVLEKILAGTYEPKASPQNGAQRKALIKKLRRAMTNGNADVALKTLDALAAIDDQVAADAALTKFEILTGAGRYDEAYKVCADQLAGDDAQIINALSWSILDGEGIERRDYAMAIKLAERAAELTKGQEAGVLDTLARAYFESGDVAKAVETQRRAIETANDEDRDQMKATLERYEKSSGGPAKPAAAE